MNTEFVGGKWKELRGSIKNVWGQLTDDDLDKINGQLHELEGRLQQRYGWGKETARDAVSGFLRSVKV